MKRVVAMRGTVMRWLRPARLARMVPRLAKAGAIVVVLAVVFFAIGAAISLAYDQYGFHPEKNARTWAGLRPAYVESGSCRACHAAEYVPWTASKHAVIACESCHGAQGAHASAAGGAAATVLVVGPLDQICTACHGRVLGRPAALPQEDAATHYGAGACLDCHDAHTTLAERPVVVAHPLANLPECRVCHGAQGLNPAPVGHKETADQVCLGCHGPQREPSERAAP